MNKNEIILQQVEEIGRSGRLGKSDIYAKLLAYLAQRSVDGSRPKEIEIAIDVFGRDASFDVAQDALVRVYIHKLRRKLESYYRANTEPHEFELQLPKGSYQLEVIHIPEQKTETQTATNKRPYLGLALLAVIALLLINATLLIHQASERTASPETLDVSHSYVWSDMLRDERPLLIVLGDLFVFSELNDQFEEIREIRDLRINSLSDLNHLTEMKPDLKAKYRSFSTSYLPKSTMYGLNYVIPVVQSAGKEITFRLMSRLTEEERRQNNLIYIGFLNSMGDLGKLTFERSRFMPHPSYLLLVDKQSGDIFAGEGDINESYSDRYLDYGLFAKYRGPDDNHIMVFAAIRNAGLAYTAGAITSAPQLDNLENYLEANGIDPNGSFEALYEISGFDYDSLDNKVSVAGKLADGAIANEAANEASPPSPHPDQTSAN